MPVPKHIPLRTIPYNNKAVPLKISIGSPNLNLPSAIRMKALKLLVKYGQLLMSAAEPLQAPLAQLSTLGIPGASARCIRVLLRCLL
jgi:hypothetical protein